MKFRIDEIILRPFPLLNQLTVDQILTVIWKAIVSVMMVTSVIQPLVNA